MITENLQIVRYDITAFDILFEGESTPVNLHPDFIKSLVIEKKFDTHYFPVTWVKLALTSALYFKIVDNKTSVKFRMKLQSYTTPYGQDLSTTRKVYDNVFNETFTIFMDEDTPFVDKKTYEGLNNTELSQNNPNDTTGKEFTFYIFKDKVIDVSRKHYNEVLTSVTPMDAFTYLLSSAKVNKVLMTPFDNKTRYPELLLPPLTFIGLIEYIDNAYGTFMDGLLTYFDIERTYVINKTYKCTAWETGEIKKTMVYVRSDSTGGALSTGSVFDKALGSVVINVSASNVNFTSPSTSSNIIAGNTLMYVDTTDGAVNTQHSENVKQRGDSNQRVVMDKFNNVYARTSQRRRVEEMREVANVMVADADIRSLTPNKEFTVTFEDSALTKSRGGNYRLSAVTHYFKREGTTFTVTSNLTLFKTN